MKATGFGNARLGIRRNLQRQVAAGGEHRRERIFDIETVRHREHEARLIGDPGADRGRPQFIRLARVGGLFEKRLFGERLRREMQDQIGGPLPRFLQARRLAGHDVEIAGFDPQRDEIFGPDRRPARAACLEEIADMILKPWKGKERTNLDLAEPVGLQDRCAGLRFGLCSGSARSSCPSRGCSNTPLLADIPSHQARSSQVVGKKCEPDIVMKPKERPDQGNRKRCAASRAKRAPKNYWLSAFLPR